MSRWPTVAPPAMAMPVVAVPVMAAAVVAGGALLHLAIERYLWNRSLSPGPAAAVGSDGIASESKRGSTG